MQGVVYKSTGSWYWVKADNGHFYRARIKGKMKIDKNISSSNPVAVGDVVEMEVEQGDIDQSMVHYIAHRRNYIVRLSPHNKHQKHIVAANLDLALVMATIQHPQTSLGFIDRFLVTAQAYHIPALLLINKSDLLDREGLERLLRWQNIYTAIGYKVVVVSAKQAHTLDPLKACLQGKTTLISGHSGVGKSTLINQLIPEADLRTEVISDYSGKGQHTTTFAEMFDLPQGGAIIDTPGVKEFGLIDIEQDELALYFPEMQRLLHQCRFSNCKHINEPGCAVKEALQSDGISPERYHSYLNIWDSIAKAW